MAAANSFLLQNDAPWCGCAAAVCPPCRWRAVGYFQAFAVPNGADYKGDSACFLWKLRGFLFGTGLALTMQLYKRRPNTTAGLRALCTPTTPSLTHRPMRKTELALTAFHVEEVTLGPELTLPTRLQVAPRLRFQKRSSRRAR